jgi:hypothetical protein
MKSSEKKRKNSKKIEKFRIKTKKNEKFRKKRKNTKSFEKKTKCTEKKRKKTNTITCRELLLYAQFLPVLKIILVPTRLVPQVIKSKS